MSKPTKQDCRGCYNDVYNHGCGGAQECWSFKDTTMVKRLDVPVHMRPPYTSLKPMSRPSCYKAQGYVRVDPEKSLTKDGFWKGF